MNRLEALRAIVQDHAARYVEGVFVDAQSARVILEVHDRLSERNRELYLARSLEDMAGLAWRLVAKAKGRMEVRA